jgi:hypothetical protein
LSPARNWLSHPASVQAARPRTSAVNEGSRIACAQAASASRRRVPAASPISARH